MCACIYAYVHVCMYIHVYTVLYVCIIYGDGVQVCMHVAYIFALIHKHIYRFVNFMYLSVDIHAYTQKCACMYVYMHVCIYACMYYVST